MKHSLVINLDQLHHAYQIMPFGGSGRVIGIGIA